MPVLARGLEAAGFSTVTVTMMPFLAQRGGCPRNVGVEFPFGHPLGLPGNRELQLRVIRAALRLLEDAREPGETVELPDEWPVPLEVAYKAWQPREASPIVAHMIAQARKRREAESRS